MTGERGEAAGHIIEQPPVAPILLRKMLEPLVRFAVGQRRAIDEQLADAPAAVLAERNRAAEKRRQVLLAEGFASAPTTPVP